MTSFSVIVVTVFIMFPFLFAILGYKTGMAAFSTAIPVSKFISYWNIKLF